MMNSPVRKFLAAVAVAACLPLLPQTASAAPAANLPDFTDLVDKVGPAVVNIRTTARIPTAARGLPPGMDEGDMSEFFRRFFGIPLPQGPRQPGTPRGGNNDDGSGSGSGSGNQDTPDNSDSEQNNGVGSGFILSADGYVMTNAHVVDDADSIYVTLTDKREFKAKLIGVDDRTDVAVVKISAANLPIITIGDSNKVRVGEWVVAIGSPFGLENTVTAGIVSAKGRDTGDYLPFIQTDVAVNPGNSGGPLINMQGEVIGINSQIYSRTGGFMGISFAIPIDEAMRVADQLKTSGKVVRGRIAVAIGEVTKDVADSLGLPKAQGALVSSVEPGGPADKAGVQPGDIILKFNGRSVDMATDLPRMVGDTKPGAKATLTIWRKGQTRDLQVTVAETQPDKTAKADQQKAPAQKPHATNALGISVSDIPADQMKTLKLRAECRSIRSTGQPHGSGCRRATSFCASATPILRVQSSSTTSHRISIRRSRSRFWSGAGDSTQFVPVRPRGAPAPQ